MDCSRPGSSVPGISQARILEWVAMPSSRGSSQPRDQTHDSFTSEPPGRPLYLLTLLQSSLQYEPPPDFYLLFSPKAGHIAHLVPCCIIRPARRIVASPSASAVRMSQSRPPQLSRDCHSSLLPALCILHVSQDALCKGGSARADSTLSLMILPWLPTAIWINTKLLTLAFHLGGLPSHCACSPCPTPSVVPSDVLAWPPSEESATVLVWQESSRPHICGFRQCNTMPSCHRTIMKTAAPLPHPISTSQPCSPEQPLLMFLVILLVIISIISK